MEEAHAALLPCRHTGAQRDVSHRNKTALLQIQGLVRLLTNPAVIGCRSAFLTQQNRLPTGASSALDCY